MAPYKVLYSRRGRTLLHWQQIDDALMIRPELIQVTTQKVRIMQERQKVAMSRQKSYVTEDADP